MMEKKKKKKKEGTVHYLTNSFASCSHVLLKDFTGVWAKNNFSYRFIIMDFDNNVNAFIEDASTTMEYDRLF